MDTKNRHLNLFQFFSQDQSKENIEDNLSRAFVLSLKNNNLLFHEFIRNLIVLSEKESVYNYLFSNFNDEEQLVIDIQKEVSSIEDSEFKYIFPVAITSKEHDMDNFFSYQFNAPKSYKPITDIIITIKDVIFILEVKRWDEDCRQQLYNQTFQLTNGDINPDRIFPVCYDWKKIMSLINTIVNFQKLNNMQDEFLEDFVSLVRSFNTNWLPIIPFSSISDKKEDEDKRKMRLDAIIYEAGNTVELLDYKDRVGFKLDFGWAQEILCYFEEFKGELCLAVYIWPGNTKTQGWKVFGSDKHEDLNNLKAFEYNSNSFPIVVENEIKLCHFNRFVSEIDFTIQDTITPIVTKDIFKKYTGKHNRDDWRALETFLNNSFKSEFDWKARCKWEDKFIKTSRNYLTMSLGYQISIKVPYSFLQSVDKKVNNRKMVSDLLIAIHDFYKQLL